MSYAATVLKIMIASPSDVIDERNIIKETIYEWNAIHSESKNIVLLPISWETHSSPEMGIPPQEVINKQVLKDCDILIGVFWTRIGTSTESYQSGTVEEIEEHIKAGKLAMLYFSSAPVIPDSVDPLQYNKLKVFKESCQGRSLYETYSNVNEFKSKLNRQLQIHLNSKRFNSINNNSILQTTIAQTMPQLSEEAKILLKEGSADMKGVILHLDSLDVSMIQTNNKKLFSGTDPKERAIWSGAMEELEKNGLIKAKNHKKQVYELTRKGYEIANTLQEGD